MLIFLRLISFSLPPLCDACSALLYDAVRCGAVRNIIEVKNEKGGRGCRRVNWRNWRNRRVKNSGDLMGQEVVGRWQFGKIGR